MLARGAFSFDELPGALGRVREPNARELKATGVPEFMIEEASAKVRAGPPIDDAEDMSFPVWAGVLPLALTAGEPAGETEGPPPPYLPGPGSPLEC